METEPDFNFDFFLAEKMRCTVAELHQRLSAREWIEWGVYYGRKAQAIELATLRAR
jgi:hypothetical protein